MECNHEWIEIDQKTKYEKGRELAGYSGYSGWGGANSPFYRNGSYQYLITTEKCSKCEETKETKKCIGFSEDY